MGAVGVAAIAGAVYKYGLKKQRRASGSAPPSINGVTIDDARVKGILGIVDSEHLYAVWDVDVMTAQERDVVAARLAYARTACSNDKQQAPSDAHPAVKFAAFAGGSKEAFVAAVSVYYHADVMDVGLDTLYERHRDTIQSLV